MTESHRPTSFTFTAPISDRGPTGRWPHLFLPPDASRWLGKRGVVPIVMMVNGRRFRRAAKPDGHGGHFVLFNSDMRAETGARAGSLVSVVMRIDPASREVVVPAELKHALREMPAANAAFKAMPPSHRKGYIEFIEEAKKPETRQRRIEKALLMMMEWYRKRSGSG